jgi:RimJ/RimL family protein N-acetyltransferase
MSPVAENPIDAAHRAWDDSPVKLTVPPNTDRLRFRLFRDDDRDLAIGLWGDSRVTALIDARGSLDAEMVRNKLDEEIARARETGLQYWPIFLRDGGDHVGCAGLRARDLERGMLEIGFHLKPAFWGRGLAREAALGVIRFAFDELGATELFAGHHPKNDASRKLLLALGFAPTHDELYPPTGLMHPSYRLARPR